MLTRICEPGMLEIGDPLPCHLYDPAVEWHAPLVVLRPDSGVAAPAAAVQPPVRHPKPMEPGQAVAFGLCMLWMAYLTLKMIGAA